MTKTDPLHLSSRKLDIWNDVSNKLHSASEIALFLDYDGTLTPIKNTPSKAVLSTKAKNLLRQLAHLHDVKLTIVTGRMMKDIRKLVPIKNIGFAANHGLHIIQSGSEWIHPVAISYIHILQKVRSILKDALLEYPKAFIEDKQLTLSIHYRNIPTDQEPSLIKLAMKTVREYDTTLLITHGKKVLEIRPPITWGKGNAILDIFQKSKSIHRPLLFFIGDDNTDEDAFQMLPSSGITIRVGDKSATNARYYVKEVEEVLQLLKLIVTLRLHRDHRQ